MTPVRNQILVKPFPSDEISDGGIYVPDSARAISNKMLIVKVGNGTKRKPMKLREGQIGYRVKDWGLDMMIDGELHFIMSDDSILATE